MTRKLAMSAILLAGGKSSRMGRDKALLAFGGETVLEFLSGLLQSVFKETLIILNDRERYEGLNLRRAKIYTDLLENKGPLAALYTGLCYSTHAASCVFTCDMPLVDEVLIRQLAAFWRDGEDVVCLEDSEKRLQPFPGIYGRASRSLMRVLLERGETAIRRFLDVASVRSLVLAEERIRVLANMNTIEDYYRVLREKQEQVRG